jgi:flagellar hook assembly protein FlgD
MRLFLITFALILFIVTESRSQSDTLIINLKSGQVEKIAVSQIHKIQFENITAVAEQSKPSNGLAVIGNYPNPFEEQTSIEFEIASAGYVEVIINDINGNHIQTLKCDNCQTGKNTIQWNCLDKLNNKIRAGVYFYEVRFKNEIQSKKMMSIK